MQEEADAADFRSVEQPTVSRPADDSLTETPFAETRPTALREEEQSADARTEGEISTWSRTPQEPQAMQNSLSAQRKPGSRAAGRAHDSQNSLLMRFITQRRPDDVFLLDDENLTDEEKSKHY